MIIITYDENETMLEGAKLGASLAPGAIVAMYGGLGSGKTTFARGLAVGMGIDSPVVSPTFTIVNEYPGKTPFFHFDLYRLRGVEDLFDIGWDEYLEQGGVCAVEWSERIPNAIPPDAIVVKIDILGDGTRRLEIVAGS